MLSYSVIGTVIGMALTATRPPAWASPPPASHLPAKAIELLATFPGGKVTADLVLTRAIAYADSFQAIRAQLASAEAPRLQAESAHDTWLTAAIDRTDNQNEPASPFSTTRVRRSATSLGASRYFSTGTSVSADVGYDVSELGFQTVAPISYRQATAALSVSQKLWKDALGSGSRRALEAGRLSGEVVAQEYRQAAQAWVLELMQVFYSAWIGQHQIRVAEESLKRRVRLLEITGLKLKRGTAEAPDFHQVKSALLQAEVALAEARQSLGDIWRSLVHALKLPEAWEAIDPALIPIEVDDPAGFALQACAADRPPQPSAGAARAKALAEASRLTLERLENAEKPDLELKGALATNGIDSASAGRAFSEAARGSHPAWTVGLQLKLPLGNEAARSARLSALSTHLRAEAAESDEAAQDRLLWKNTCLDLRRLDEAHRKIAEARDHQARRASDEEKRFAIGRVPTLAVVEAADDADQVELALRRQEVVLRLAAWKVRRLVDGFEAYVAPGTGGVEPKASPAVTR